MFHRCVLDGDPNASFLDDVWANVDRLSESKEDVILDLSRVDFMDSHGVGAVVALMRRLSCKGLQLKVIGLHGQPLRLFLDLHLVPVSGSANGRLC
jgi:anti-anti-sigma factor